MDSSYNLCIFLLNIQWMFSRAAWAASRCNSSHLRAMWFIPKFCLPYFWVGIRASRFSCALATEIDAVRLSGWERLVSVEPPLLVNAVVKICWQSQDLPYLCVEQHDHIGKLHCGSLSYTEWSTVDLGVDHWRQAEFGMVRRRKVGADLHTLN